MGESLNKGKSNMKEKMSKFKNFFKSKIKEQKEKDKPEPEPTQPPPVVD